MLRSRHIRLVLASQSIIPILGMMLLWYVSGCSSSAENGAKPHISAETLNPSSPIAPVVRDVFFGTDRATNLRTDSPLQQFTSDRGHALTLGVCRISIPPNHLPGNIERPWRFWIIGRSENPQEDFTLKQITTLSSDEFCNQLHDEVAISRGRPADHDVLVFIHGYNVSFADAAFRTAQIVYDMNFTGVAAMYSWPSQGQVADYLWDEASIEQSATYLAQYLRLIKSSSGAAHIDVIVHSMGNRALLEALDLIKEEQIAGGPLVDQLVCAAPDVDVDTFTQSFHRIESLVGRCTLYGSSDDKAIEASHAVHHYTRAGDGGANLLLFHDIDSVDASGADLTYLGHSYFGETVAVMNDISLVLDGKLPPRHLYPHNRSMYLYWSIMNHN